MIITNVCLLLEALSIVICLHHLYGEKFRLDIATVSFLSIDMIIMTAINYFEMERIHTMIIYPIIILYCGLKFGFRLHKMIVNIILCIVLIGVTQMVVTFCLCYVFKLHSVTETGLIIVGCIEFVLILFVVPKVKIKRLTRFLQDNEKILVMAIGLSIIIALLWLISYKKIKLMEAYQAILLFSTIGFVLILSGKLIKYKLKAKEAEIELKMHQIYSESFQGLVDNIRLRQHEFDNHLNAIYSLHYSCHTFEELVEAQKRYCGNITESNRFCKLLTAGNAIVSGFLYKRFVEIDKMGIEIIYHVILDGCEIGIPTYKVVEILGDLINNAVEAIETGSENNKIYVEIIEKNTFFIEVRNESPYVEFDSLKNFFVKGYSMKGKGRGLGLYNVKQICEEYNLEIAANWIEVDRTGWLSFKIRKVE